MNGTLVSRITSLMLVGILVAIGGSQASAAIFDNFSSDNPPAVLTGVATFAGAPNTASTAGSPVYGGGASGWSISYAPTVPISAVSVGANVTETGLTIAGIAGSTRSSTLTATNVSSAINNAGMGLTVGSPGTFGLTTGGLTQGQLVLNYTLGSTLNNVTGIQVPLTVMDHGAPIILSINGGPGMEQFPPTVGPPSPAEDVDFSFLPTNINTLSIQLGDGTIPALQIQVQGPITYTQGNPVPEPSSLAIWALTGGIGGLGLIRVSRNRR